MELQILTTMKHLTTKIKFLLPLLMSIIFVSCEKVIDIDLNEAEPRLVVEGAITLDNLPNAVRLSTSGDFFTGKGIAPVNDAVVEISASNGQIETLKNIGSGIYLTQKITGTANTNYTLNITYNNNNYTASDTLPMQVNIEDVTYSISEFGNSGPNGDEFANHYDFFCKFKDQGGKRNYYLLQIKLNGEPVEGRRGKYSLLSDEYSNGQMINYPFFGVGANDNDTISIELSAIGHATYDYFRTLNDAISQGGMGSTPYNPISNVSNNALGYFGTFTFDSKSIIVEPL